MRRPSLSGSAALLASGVALACCQPAATPEMAADGWGPSAGLGRSAQEPDQRPRPDAPRAELIPEAQRKRWPQADELASATQIGGRGLSEHQTPGTERTLWVNEAAAGYAQLVAGATLPPGAIVAQRHHPVGSDEVSSWYVMFKPPAPVGSAPGAWAFVVLDGQMRVAADDDLELCARCHLEAPHDSLFGPPVDLTQLPAAPSAQP